MSKTPTLVQKDPAYDYDAIVVSLWTMLRGDKTQNQLSEEMGWTYNKVHRIEAGTVRPSWKDFLLCCEVVGASVSEALNYGLGFSVGDLSSSSSIFKHLTSGLDIEGAAKKLGKSQSTIRRWLQSASDPDAAEVFRWLALFNNALRPFLHGLVGEEHVQKIDEHLSQEVDRRSLLSKYPVLEAVLRILNMPHIDPEEPPSAKQIQGMLRFESADLNVAFDLFVKFLGGEEKLRDFIVDGDDTPRFSLCGDREAIRSQNLYWIKVLTEILAQEDNPKRKTMGGYRVFSLDSKKREEIINLSLEYYQNIGNILGRKTYDPPEHLMAMNILLADLLE